MAKRIDRMVVWIFVTVSAFLLMLEVTAQHVLISALLTFALVFTLRIFIRRIPERRRIRKKDKLAFIRHLLGKWALGESQAVLEEIARLIPDFSDTSHTLLIQRLPDEEPLSANILLDIWRAHRADEKLLLIATCMCESSAHALVSRLERPCIELIDSERLTALLLPVLTDIPIEQIQKEQRVSFSRRAALWIQAVHPFRTGCYALLFGLFFLLGRSWVHALSAAVFAALTLIRFLLGRKNSPRLS